MTTKKRIEKEAFDYAQNHKEYGVYIGYIAGATREHNLSEGSMKELQQEVRKYVFWHDKFFNDTIVGQPPSLQPLRDLIAKFDSSES